MTLELPYRFLADLVLVLHLAVAVFVVGYPLLFVGGVAARHPRLAGAGVRSVHGAIVGLVVVQAWRGKVCPLTTLEGWLRLQGSGTAYDGGFIEFWLGRILFHAAPAWVFIAGYSVFGVLVALMWWRRPPPAGSWSLLAVLGLAAGLAACAAHQDAADIADSRQRPEMDTARMCEVHELMMTGSSAEEQQTMLEQYLRSMHGTIDAQMVARHRQAMRTNCPGPVPGQP